MGLTVSCDFNYRNKLWNYGQSAHEVMRELVKNVDIGIGNANNCRQALGIQLDDGDLGRDGISAGLQVNDYEALGKKIIASFPKMKIQAFTLRQIISANHNQWSACIYNGEEFIVSRSYDIANIVDRIGAGDAFAAGLIYGLSTGIEEKDALEFATAASCLKHSIVGDMNLVSLEEVFKLLEANGPK